MRLCSFLVLSACCLFEDGDGSPNLPNFGVGADDSVGTNYYENMTHGEKVVILNERTYPHPKSKENWMIKFYAPWCGACKGMRKTWAILAGRSNGDYKVGALDCTNSLNRHFCQQFKLDRFPHIKFVSGGKSKEYKGSQMSVYEMKQFIKKNSVKTGKKSRGGKKQCPGGQFSKKSGVKEFCEHIFPYGGSKHIWLVNFYLSWDAYSKTFNKKWRKMAKELVEADDFRLGAVDCVRNVNLCTDLGIQSKWPGKIRCECAAVKSWRCHSV